MMTVEVVVITVLILYLTYLFSPVYNFIFSWLQRNHVRRKGIQADSTATTELPTYDNIPTVQKESLFSYDWFTSPRTFALERRAIFSTSWHHVTYICNLPAIGSYLTPPPIGGYSIFLIRGKDNTIRAFHNVCRHRAYEVTRKECGKSLVLGCGYHGWSYDTRGKLVKAPEFDGVKGFERQDNGLWEVRTRVKDGRVEVCLDTVIIDESDISNSPEALAQPRSTRSEERLSRWKVEGAFNWKLAIRFLDSLDISGPSTAWSVIMSTFRSQKQQTSHVFPLTTLHYSPQSSLCLAITLFPKSATSTTVQCEVYTAKRGSKYGNETIVSDLKRTVESRIAALAASQAEILQSECQVDLSAEDLVAQNKIHEMLKAHVKREKIEGREIHPAARITSFTEAGRADDDLCRELELGAARLRVAEMDQSSRYKESLHW